MTVQSSIKPFHAHLVWSTGLTDWPERIEISLDPAPSILKILKDFNEKTGIMIKLSASSRKPESPLEFHLFPFNYRFSLESLAELEPVLENRLESPVNNAPTAGKKVFLVCIHGSRDARCGEHGGAIVKVLEEWVHTSGSQAEVYGTSHLGGHKYAGNVLVYPEGLWYGLVTADTAVGLARHILLGDPKPSCLLRGRMSPLP